MEAGPFLAQGLHSSAKAGSPLTKKPQTSISALECGPLRQGPDRQRACGRRPDMMAAIAGAEDRASPRPAPTAPGWPSPTAATLPRAALSQGLDVFAVQAKLGGRRASGRMWMRSWTFRVASFRKMERGTDPARGSRNNAQGILGYCRALDRPGHRLPQKCRTSTISVSWKTGPRCGFPSQHIANWPPSRHLQPRSGPWRVMRRMAVVVDQQNAGDPH